MRRTPIPVLVVGVVFGLLTVGLFVFFGTEDQEPYRDGTLTEHVAIVERTDPTESGCSGDGDTSFELSWPEGEETAYGETRGCKGDHEKGDQVQVWERPDGSITTDSPRLHELAATFLPWLVALIGIALAWVLLRRSRT